MILTVQGTAPEIYRAPAQPNHRSRQRIECGARQRM